MRGDQVGGGGLERLDQFAQFLLLQAAGQPGEADQVGEAHREAPVDHLRVVLGLHDAAGRGGELAAPDVDEELLQLGQEQFDEGVGDLRTGQAGVLRLGQALQEGVDLPVGEARRGLPGGAGHLHRHRLAEQSGLHQAREPAQRQHVGLGERLDLADVREAHGAPEAGGQFHGDAGAAGRLEGGVAAVGTEDQLFQADGDGVVVGAVARAVGARPVRRAGRGAGPVGAAGLVRPVGATGPVRPVGTGGLGRAVGARRAVRRRRVPLTWSGPRLTRGDVRFARAGARVVGGHRSLPVRSLRTALPITSRSFARSTADGLNDTAGVLWLTLTPRRYRPDRHISAIAPEVS